MAKTELGTKRVDPETGRKFYDLNKDPIVSPYTGKTYPRSYFEESKAAVEEEEDVEAKEVDADEDEGVEVVSLEDADDDAKADDLPDLGDDDDDVDLGDDEDDAFLADEEEEDDDVGGIVGVSDDDDEV
ncbi:MAG: TIGR02300 family protein [Mesorhizobium sp.]